MSKNQSGTSSEKGRIIFAHQRHAFERLVEIARACFFTSRETLPVSIRANSLIIGPSGSGKSFLARAVADHIGEVGVPFLDLSISDWVLLGNSERGGINTWPAIARFLQANRRKEGVIIFVDELQHAWGDCAYERFLRVELFSLFDLRLPHGLSAKIDDEIGERTFAPSDLAEIQDVLSNRTMIIGAGAFQEIWERQDTKPVGFHSLGAAMEIPTLTNLAETLPTELINRFRSELLILRPLELHDYESMLEVTARLVPSYLRETFLRLGYERLPEVTRLRQGTRYLEELMLDTLLEERALMRDSNRPAPQLELDQEDSSPNIVDPSF